LIKGHKFDFRLFGIIVSVDPLIAMWAPDSSHTRVSDKVFDVNSQDVTTHITANVASSKEVDYNFLMQHRFNLREIGEYFKD